jgi:hypothetical protein
MSQNPGHSGRSGRSPLLGNSRKCTSGLRTPGCAAQSPLRDTFPSSGPTYQAEGIELLFFRGLGAPREAPGPRRFWGPGQDRPAHQPIRMGCSDWNTSAPWNGRDLHPWGRLGVARRAEMRPIGCDPLSGVRKADFPFYFSMLQNCEGVGPERCVDRISYTGSRAILGGPPPPPRCALTGCQPQSGPAALESLEESGR